MNKQEQLENWAKEAVKTFNELSTANKIGYYQQSPLNKFKENPKITAIENLIIGYNPGSMGASTLHTAKSFLLGNPNWSNHLDWKYFKNAHYFICGTNSTNTDDFNDDLKTVWTNLTPLGTKTKGSVSDKILEVSIPHLIELIRILEPKRIYLLGKELFNILEKNGKCAEIKRYPIVKDRIGHGVLEIGSIDGHVTIQLPHPSQNWGFHRLFVPIFTKLWHTTLAEKKIDPNINVADKMRTQLTRLVPME